MAYWIVVGSEENMRKGDSAGAGVHEEVAAGALAPGVPGQPPRDPGERLRADRGADAAARSQRLDSHTRTSRPDRVGHCGDKSEDVQRVNRG